MKFLERIVIVSSFSFVAKEKRKKEKKESDKSKRFVIPRSALCNRVLPWIQKEIFIVRKKLDARHNGR